MNINCNLEFHNNIDSTNKRKLNLLLNGCLLGFNKKPVWLDKAFLVISKGHISRTEITKRKLSFFKLYNVFVEKYGKDFELLFYYNTDTGYINFYFAVVYPIFELTNSEGRKHTIRDLVVCHTFEFENNNYHPCRPLGGRITKTALEVHANYQQSHLTSYSSFLKEPFYVSSFCIGNDDASRILAEFTIEMDYDRFELYLYLIDSMVKWESLEGVPYYYMKSIVDNRYVHIASTNNGYENNVVEYILKRKIPLDVDFYVSQDRYKIANNVKALKFIKAAMAKCSGHIYDVFCCVYSPFVKKYYSKKVVLESERRSRVKPNTQHYFIYGGVKVYAKVINQSEQSKKVLEEDYIIYPKFLENVLRKLEYAIYEKAITSGRNGSIDTSDNAKQSTTTDTISL